MKIVKWVKHDIFVSKQHCKLLWKGNLKIVPGNFKAVMRTYVKLGIEVKFKFLAALQPRKPSQLK